MHDSHKKVCIVLPYPPSYSETFLRCHVEKLSAVVNYLERFPVTVNGAYGSQLSYDDYGKLVQTLKSTAHRYVLNPAKNVYLSNFFRAHHINVVLAEFGESGVGALGICKRLQIPLVVHFHGSDAYSTAIIERHRDGYKKLFGYASAIIAVSRHMAEQLVALGAPRKKVVYNPYGVEIDKFKHSGPKLPRQVIAVGRFVEKKAPYLTILAFKKVLEYVPDARLVMVGDGMLHDMCHQLTRSLHIEHAVDFKGIVTNDEIARLMQQSAVFTQHSLVPESGDTEGTPMAILEAGASALPVVSTRHAGITDAVVHGKTGFLVAEGDIDGMSHYICQLLTNPGMAHEMGKHARAHIAENFNLAGSIKNLRDILDNSMAGNAS
jgi:glycosyltransferase involved in cell wall biosynthesis